MFDTQALAIPQDLVHELGDEPLFDARTVTRVRAAFADITSVDGGGERLVGHFYAALFADRPDYRLLFPPNMEAQTGKLLTVLRFVVDSLTDPDPMLDFLAQLGRDHRKYGLDRRHYDAAHAALLTAVSSSLVTLLWSPTVEAAWRRVADVVTGTMSDAADAEELPAVWHATGVGHERRLDDVAIVRLEADGPVPFAAGQYVSVQVPQRPRLWRYLSVAIPPNPYGQLEFHVRRVSGGWVSPAIVGETAVGDRWSIGAPLGGLHVDRSSDRDVLMIGSGTGIAPLRAQVMEMAMRGTNPRVHLFVGGTYPRDCYDLETLWQLSLSNPWLTVVPVSEEADDPWWHTAPPVELPPGMHRPLTGPIGKVVASFGSWADRTIQISGSPSMIKTTIYALRGAGTPPEIIQHDPLI
ncbi:globin domain-containing protein [Rhodococcus sp. HNM0569]|uniref:globin domain-containing protein n=1 Tax=Rhodococcus sp. HNM0569 TaxID=2716340 RepID=UPI00146E787D|nr:globin domain-containing protein [Rhodococcus sp. HNM0569]NLU83248.1 flavoprotein [Rhodococcus sp. HNM0569]